MKKNRRIRYTPQYKNAIVTSSSRKSTSEGNALLYTISNIIPSGVLWRNTSAVAAERMEVVGY
jgi:hypothetical protein